MHTPTAAKILRLIFLLFILIIKEIAHYVLFPALVALTQAINKQVCTAQFTYMHACVSKTLQKV
jgi:hypothetical protein